MHTSTHAPPTTRREVLRNALPDSVAMLYRRRACDIPEGFIEDYVALNWLEWHGGALRVTTTGENMCEQLLQRRPS
jgi:hypothetical protein